MSNPVTVHFMAARQESPMQELVARPSRIYLGVGEQAPPIQVEGRALNAQQFRSVAASLSSVDPNVLAKQNGVFTAISPGTTQILAKHQGVETAIAVEVAGRLFRSVERVGERDLGGSFVVDLRVDATLQPEPIEYQLVRAGEKPIEGKWITASENNGRLSVVLTSPPQKVRFQQTTRMEIFARGQTTQRIERYPYAMTLRIEDAQAGSN